MLGYLLNENNEALNSIRDHYHQRTIGEMGYKCVLLTLKRRQFQVKISFNINKMMQTKKTRKKEENYKRERKSERHEQDSNSPLNPILPFNKQYVKNILKNGNENRA